VPSVATASRPRRADAQRKRASLLKAAHAVFLEEGVDAPLEHIAKEAGTGQGTLYRHFPTREHLWAAIIEHGCDEQEISALRAMTADDTETAFDDWLIRASELGGLYPGTSTHIGPLYNDLTSPVGQQCAGMVDAFSLLLAKAQHEGLVRSDVTAEDIMSIVISLPKNPQTGKPSKLSLTILLAGLKQTCLKQT